MKGSISVYSLVNKSEDRWSSFERLLCNFLKVERCVQDYFLNFSKLRYWSVGEWLREDNDLGRKLKVILCYIKTIIDIILYNCITCYITSH